MYIVFDDNGREFLRYYNEELPTEFTNSNYRKVSEKDIPEKEGCNTVAYLVDGKVEFKFEELPVDETEELKKEIESLKSANKANMLALMEINTRLNSSEVK